MGARNRLPEPLGDKIRVEPYRISLRTQYAKPEWRKVAGDYYATAKAWRIELQGNEGWADRDVVSFGSWKRLRDGKPEAFGAYDQARCKVLDQPTDHPRDVADKIQILAEVLGVADPSEVLHGWAKDVPEGGWTLADKAFAALWRDACAAARRVEAERSKACKKGKR